MPRVLIVEDDDAIRTLLVAALRREAFEVDAATDGVQALELTRAGEYSVIVLDLMMPRLDGFAFLDAFHNASPRPRSVIIVMTAFDDAKAAGLPARYVHALIRKPFDVGQLVTMIREVAATWHSHTTAAVPAPAERKEDGEQPSLEPTN